MLPMEFEFMSVGGTDTYTWGVPIRVCGGSYNVKGWFQCRAELERCWPDELRTVVRRGLLQESVFRSWGFVHTHHCVKCVVQI